MTTTDDPDEIVLSGHSSRRAAAGAAITAFVAFGALAVWLLVVRDHHPALMVVGAVFAAASVLGPVSILLDTYGRGYRVTRAALVCFGGVVNRFEVDVALSHVGGVSLRQGPIQRFLGCGDVLVFAHGIHGATGIVMTSADLNSIRLRSIQDFQEVAAFLRARMHASQIRGPGAPVTTVDPVAH